jgi:hypothetical protein
MTQKFNIIILRCAAPINSIPNPSATNITVRCTFFYYVKHSATNISVLRTLKIYYKSSATDASVLCTFLTENVNNRYRTVPMPTYYNFETKQQSCEIFVET